jgi:hypothetical protein
MFEKKHPFPPGGELGEGAFQACAGHFQEEGSMAVPGTPTGVLSIGNIRTRVGYSLMSGDAAFGYTLFPARAKKPFVTLIRSSFDQAWL